MLRGFMSIGVAQGIAQAVASKPNLVLRGFMSIGVAQSHTLAYSFPG